MTTADEVTHTAEKLDFKKIMPVLVIILVDLLGLSIIIPLMPLYAARFGANALVIGLLGSTYPFMQFIGAPVLGRLSDRFGRRPILIVSQIGTFLGFILLGFANVLPLLFLSRVIDGLSGANISTAQAVITDLTTDETRTQGLGLIGAAFGMGFILGPIIAFAVLIASHDNYQAVAFTAAFFSLASLLLTTFWLPETRNPQKNRLGGKSPFSFQAMAQSLNRPTIGVLLVLMFAQQLAFGGYEQMFSLFALNRLGMGARDTSGLFVLAGLFIVAIQGGFIGPWSKKYGDRWLVMLGLSTLAIGLILTALTPQIPVPWYNQAKITAEMQGRASTQIINVALPAESSKGWLGIIWVLIASFPAALGGGVLHPAINSLITKSAGKDEVGGILGVSSGFYSAANAITPLFFGSLFQWFGAPVPFLLGGLLLAVLWVIAMRTVKVPQTAQTQ
ncbi:MAG: MFS transporter [Chloroflexi bacterium]|nr:MFS transporter [Chloroflexota bacterium]